MEPTTMNNEENQKNPLKKWIVILAILAGLLLCTTIYLGFFAKPTLNKEYIKTEAERLHLESELELLMVEHDKKKTENEELAAMLSEKDSVIMANAEEIKKLINTQADYNKIKKQLARLQNIAKEYVEEMDKLYEENKALKEENVQVKEHLAIEQERRIEVEKNVEDLSEKINIAAVLNAYNISGRALNVKNKNDVEVITEKANKTSRFKVSLTLGGNTLVEPGPVNIYCRIAIPETGRVLTMGDSYSFNYEGKKMQYTAKTVINYTNKAENVSLYWDIRPGDKVAKGKYLVEVYTDSQLLGESYFILN